MIGNRNMVFGKALSSSPDSDKSFQLPKIANTNLPTAGTSNEGGIVYDSTNSEVYFSDGSSWAAISSGASASTAYDDIGNPDANGSITMGAYTGTYTSATANWGGIRFANTHANPTAGAELLALNYTADGDEHGVFLVCQDNSATDEKFKVGADGATTIAGSATGTSALTVTAGDITLSAGDVDIAADNQKISFGASGDTDSYITFDGSDLTFFDATAGSATLSQLIASSPTGDFTISDGQFNWEDKTAENGAVWTFAGTTHTDVVWTSSVTSGKCLAITADDLTTGDMIYLDSTVAGLTSGKYIHCYDGGASDFTVAKYGATIIAGNASTDVLTVSAGDVQITAGDIDMDDGIITIDTDNDEGNTIKRNNDTGTNPVLEVEQSHTTGGVALLVDQNATGDVNAVEVTNAGTGYAFTTTGGAAGSEGYEFISAGNATGCGVRIDGSTTENGWVGAAGVGFLQIDSDGTLANADAHLVQIDKTGQTAASATGSSLHITDASTGGSTSGYAVYFNASGALEALHVDAGKVQFDEDLTLGVDNTGADFKAYGASANKHIHWDESEDTFVITDDTVMQFGGTGGSADGVTMDWDDTGSSLDIDAVNADEAVTIGSDTDTDLLWHGTSGVALTCDSSGDSLTVSATAKLVVTGKADGDGTLGLEIPYHATATPSGTPGTGSIIFEVDANKLWIFNGTTWVGTTLS